MRQRLPTAAPCAPSSSSTSHSRTAPSSTCVKFTEGTQQTFVVPPVIQGFLGRCSSRCSITPQLALRLHETRSRHTFDQQTQGKHGIGSKTKAQDKVVVTGQARTLMTATSRPIRCTE